jgi:hypothetical protein
MVHVRRSNAESEIVDLVANRECGKCTVCCKVLTIDDPQLQKLPGVMCPNCKTGSGCKIYDTRPDPCRGFFCGWRHLRDLDDKWRPDKSGVMIRFQGAPPGYQPPGFQFLVFGHGDLVTPSFVNYLTNLVARRAPVFLAMRGPEGFSDVSIFMNDHLTPAVTNRDRNAFVKVLRNALEAMSKNQFEKAVLKHGSPAV